MSTSVVVGMGGAVVVIAWCAWSFTWTARQTLVGTWVGALPDGTHVTLQFEGSPQGGLYKQLTKRDGTEVREFRHWTIKFLKLRMIIMATDIKEHPRFGIDTQYWVTYNSNTQTTISGPDRAKWVLQRATAGIKIEFDEPEAAG